MRKSVILNADAMSTFAAIPDNSIDCIITDPPYEVITGGSNGGKNNKPSGILSANKQLMKTIPAPKLWVEECYRTLKDGSHIYVMTNTLNLLTYLTLISNCGFKLHNLLVWKKNNTTPNRWYMKNCEYVIFARKGKAKAINNPSSQTVHSFDNVVGNKLHPTQKPVELMKHYVSNSTDIGDVVFDPFMGSGSTGVAALELGRRFLGSELEPDYFAIAEQRIKAIQ